MRTSYKTTLMILGLLLVAGLLTVASAGDQMGMHNTKIEMKNGQMGMQNSQMSMDNGKMMMKPGEMVWVHGKQMQFDKMMSAKTSASQDTLVMVPGSGAVAFNSPGAKNWHGGNWMMFQGTWKDHERKLHTMREVIAAVNSGDLTLQREPDQDFSCPLSRVSAKQEKMAKPLKKTGTNY